MKIIAFYLPQFHPTPHNDEWWGMGFTEWTNVAKARKLYPGHYQPKIPSELGFYDLRIPDVRKKQTELAKEAGITGFCYYHYWFSKGNEELDMPFKEVVKEKEPDFPFCLCWANESWYSKFWNKDGSSKKTLLAEQLYLGKDDDIAHFYSLLDAFHDNRYMKVDGRLLFLIYQPLTFPNFADFKNTWNELARKNGLPDFYFVGQARFENEVNNIFELGFDGVNHCHRLDNYYQCSNSSITRIVWRGFNALKKIIKFPFVISYKKAIKKSVFEVDYMENVFPTMMPNWDHTPRSGEGGTVLHNSTPKLFEQHAYEVLKTTEKKSEEHKIVFLKSWNEWGEGNYMEPDIRYGRGYINALRTALRKI